jgi:hypothetical protein
MCDEASASDGASIPTTTTANNSTAMAVRDALKDQLN